jgi:hypothetical protein
VAAGTPPCCRPVVLLMVAAAIELGVLALLGAVAPADIEAWRGEEAAGDWWCVGGEARLRWCHLDCGRQTVLERREKEGGWRSGGGRWLRLTTAGRRGCTLALTCDRSRLHNIIVKIKILPFQF